MIPHADMGRIEDSTKDGGHSSVSGIAAGDVAR
jgi:hypothetical protein